MRKLRDFIKQKYSDIAQRVKAGVDRLRRRKEATTSDAFLLQNESPQDRTQDLELPSNGVEQSGSKLQSVKNRIRQRVQYGFDKIKDINVKEDGLKLAGSAKDASTRFLERLKQTDSNSPFLADGFRVAAVGFAAYFLADTTSLFLDRFVPEAPSVPAPRAARVQERRKTLQDYSIITARNIFNSRGIIGDDGDASGPARKSALPLNLIGTVVLKDELKSIASIEDRAQNMVFPVHVDEVINNQIKVTKIEQLRVYFINQSTGHLEYIEVVDDLANSRVSVSTPTAKTKTTGGGQGIAVVGDNTFQIDRSTLDSKLGQLGNILQEAKAIPNYENGIPDGYRLVQIQQGSVFQQLGIQVNDVISTLDGEPINDPGKAFSIMNDLRAKSHIEIGIKRNGQRINLSYDIR